MLEVSVISGLSLLVMSVDSWTSDFLIVSSLCSMHSLLGYIPEIIRVFSLFSDVHAIQKAWLYNLVRVVYACCVQWLCVFGFFGILSL